MSECMYPDITVKLVGEDGNAFAIIGRVSAALREHLTNEEWHRDDIEKEIRTFRTEAMEGDYQNLLCTCAEWVNVK